MNTKQRIQEFLRSETVGGVILMVAALIGIVAANSPLHDAFHTLASTEIGFEALHLTLTVEEWAADGLLAIFFFIIGCELKHELVVGSLSKPRQALLPVAAALGGMAVPALIFIAINAALTGGSVRGWGIPMATDIAFALAVLAILGRGLPAGVRIFLLTMAIVDDLGAILVIALFYSESVAFECLAVAAAALALFALAQRLRITTLFIYVPIALATWYAMHSSGVHATIAGVALGMLMRVRKDPGESDAPVDRATLALHPISAGIAVPIFAFFAAAVDVRSLNVEALLGSPVLLGAFFGLVVGKPAGVYLASRLAARLGAALSPGVRWIDIAIVGAVGGIGFTMSLLISELAYANDGALSAAKLGVLSASIAAVAISALLLALRRRAVAAK